jgi:hypothetical protein
MLSELLLSYLRAVPSNGQAFLEILQITLSHKLQLLSLLDGLFITVHGSTHVFAVSLVLELALFLLFFLALNLFQLDLLQVLFIYLL